MGIPAGNDYISAYNGDQIDLLLARMAEANPLPSGMNWTAFKSDCQAAQSAAEASAEEAASAVAQAEASAAEAANSADYAEDCAERAERAAGAVIDLPITRGGGLNSIVVGDTENNIASGECSVTGGKSRTGYWSEATGNNAIAFGDRCYAGAPKGIALGQQTEVHGEGGIAAGNTCTVGANGINSVAIGNHTSAQSIEQFVFGRYNIPDTENKYLEIAGTGSNPGNPKNARTLDRQGNETLAGKLTVGAAPAGDMDAATKKYVDDGLSGKIASAEKGAANGVATLGSNGKLTNSQVPFSAHDVYDGYYYSGDFYEDAEHETLYVPESGKIFIDKPTEKLYRWNGSAYVELSPCSPVLLWTNPNVGSGATFAAQTLSLDMTPYSRIHVVYYISGGNTGVFDAIVFADGNGHNVQAIGLPQSGAATAYYRTITVTGTGIAFSACNVKTLPDAARTTSSSYIIPYKIYGLI